MGTEIWKPVPDYEELYQVSTFGTVKVYDRYRLHKRGFSNMALHKSKIMKQVVGTTGYYHVRLTKDSKSKTFKTHRLVALAFIPNPENKPEINHKDADKLNTHVSNLEWSTRKENIEHAYKLGLCNIGEEKKNSKLTDSDIIKIRKLINRGMYHKDIAPLFNIHKSLVSAISIGRVWTHI